MAYPRTDVGFITTYCRCTAVKLSQTGGFVSDGYIRQSANEWSPACRTEREGKHDGRDKQAPRVVITEFVTFYCDASTALSFPCSFSYSPSVYLVSVKIRRDSEGISLGRKKCSHCAIRKYDPLSNAVILRYFVE